MSKDLASFLQQEENIHSLYAFLLDAANSRVQRTVLVGHAGTLALASSYSLVSASSFAWLAFCMGILDSEANRFSNASRSLHWTREGKKHRELPSTWKETDFSDSCELLDRFRIGDGKSAISMSVQLGNDPPKSPQHSTFQQPASSIPVLWWHCANWRKW